MTLLKLPALAITAVLLGCPSMAVSALQTDTLESLIVQLQSGKSTEKETAAWKIGDLGSKASSAVPALAAALEDENEIVRRGAAKSRADRRSEGRPALITAARRGNVNASWALKNGGFSFAPADVQSLVAILKESKDPYVQMNLVVAIGFARSQAAVEPLVDALKSSDDNVRKNAAIALGVAGSPQATDPLIAALKTRLPWMCEPPP